MRELEFIKIIKNSLKDSSLLGDDCAYLDDLGIFITQDTLVENVHFSMYTTTPYLLGRKAVSVNLSDLAAALAKPLYITVSVSMPSSIKDNFLIELYRGINDVCSEHKVKVAGGDITSSDKIVISISAIGKKVSKYMTSRSNAKKGDYIVTTGTYGASSAGLYALQNFLVADDKLKQSHLNPKARIKEASVLSKLIKTDISAMDTSDGLADALFKIAQESSHCIEIDFDKVPVASEVIDFAKQNNIDYKEFVIWGGEDYELIACVPEDVFNKLDTSVFIPIGRVLNKDNNSYLIIKDKNNKEKITKEIFEEKTYNHFKG